MMSKNKTLVLFTNKYPFASEIFLVNELKVLGSYFERIYIIPSVEGKNITRYIPPNAQIVKEYAKYLLIQNNKKGGIMALGLWVLIFCKYFLRQILKQPHRYLHPKGVKRIIQWLGRAYINQKWIEAFIKRENLDLSETVFYSYWINLNSVALAMLKKRRKNITFIARAHGFDVYDERNPHPFVSWKFFVLPRLNKACLISEAGKKYLDTFYGEYQKNYSVFRLGTTNPNTDSAFSNENSLFILSASNVISLKRVHLILDAVLDLTSRIQNLSVQWDHFGGGPLLEELKKRVGTASSKNLTVNLHGKVPNEIVLVHYKEKPIDVFINVSEIEGIPFSIMEAHSFGVPVMATAVGGTPEIVNNSNGILLPPNPTVEEISKQLQNIAENRNQWIEKRKNAKENWNNNFNAEKNYTQFAQTLVNL